MKKHPILALAAVAAALAAGSAHASNVYWSIGIQAPPVATVISSGPVYQPYYDPAPVYRAPPPIYYAPPPPVYYAPPPVVYRPAPIVYAPPVYYQGGYGGHGWGGGHRHGHHGHHGR